jgi:hypothetical protein
VSALFSPRSNVIARRVIMAGLALLAGVPVVVFWWVRSPWMTGQGRPVAQPIPLFSHQIHAGDFGIDCRYCHSSVERAAAAGLPATTTCLPCHQRLWLESRAFGPVRRSLASGQPIPWQRVDWLPDYVYFNHAVHVHAGVGCETCHGRVDLMMTAEQTSPLTMSWCIDCHRNPAPRVRPIEEVTTMGWQPGPGMRAAPRRYDPAALLTCSACHR